MGSVVTDEEAQNLRIQYGLASRSTSSTESG